METITIDGMDEHAFRHSIENLLRLDQVDEALEKLRLLLEPVAGAGRILPERFLTVSSSDIEFVGWHKLAKRLSHHDRSTSPITAIGITLADARNLGGPGPSGGRLSPFIKTFYFADDAFPFSIASRDDLLDGYTRDGFEWEADYQASDVTLSIKGIDDLYGAVIELEERLFDIGNPDPAEVRAGSIGACYIAVLIHQALRETIREKGLPRPLCVLVACDGVYPFFDAPVVGCEEPADPEIDNGPSDDEFADEVWPTALECASPADELEFAGVLRGDASLLATFSRKGTKKPVLTVNDDDVREAAQYIQLAETHWLVVEDRDVLTRLPDGAVASSDDAPGAWTDYEALEQSVELAGGVIDEPEAASLAALPPAPHEERLADDMPFHPLTGAELSSGPLEISLATEMNLPDEQFVAPASHSLRARIKLAEPDLSKTRRDRVGALIDWLKRIIFHRR
ncbi:MAG: hypothetical protein ABJA20_08445 [Novosphingobium sp.]